jgi:hypothetical protein
VDPAAAAPAIPVPSKPANPRISQPSHRARRRAGPWRARSGGSGGWHPAPHRTALHSPHPTADRRRKKRGVGWVGGGGDEEGEIPAPACLPGRRLQGGDLGPAGTPPDPESGVGPPGRSRPTPTRKTTAGAQRRGGRRKSGRRRRRGSWAGGAYHVVAGAREGRSVGRRSGEGGWRVGDGTGAKARQGRRISDKARGFFLYKTGGAGPRWVACRAVPCRCVTALDPPTDPAVPVRGGGVRCGGRPTGSGRGLTWPSPSSVRQRA